MPDAAVRLDEIVGGDCLAVLDAMPAGFADLAYVDPPFNTGRRQVSARAAFADTTYQTSPTSLIEGDRGRGMVSGTTSLVMTGVSRSVRQPI